MKRKAGVLVGMLVLVGGLGYAQAPAVAAPVDAEKQIATMQKKLDDWPQLGRYAAENSALGGVPKGKKRVVFYGDSITDGWGRRPNTGTFFPGKAYVNRGISGQTTAQMVVRFRQDVIDLNPSVVVILAGTNDVAGNTGPMTPKMTEDNFISMVDMAKENGIKVVIASITPAFDYPWRKGLEPAEKIKSLNSWLETYCKDRGLTYLDYYSALTDDKGGMKEGTSSDGVHPTAAGYAIMAPLAQAAIDEALAKK
jgi:lysophospholipase L1-like esterase